MSHFTTRGDFWAECEDCGWKCQARNALGVGAQHHQRTGHQVRIEIERAVIYERGCCGTTVKAKATK